MNEWAYIHQPAPFRNGGTGKDETRRFLANLGFVEGGKVTVISEVAGNLIVNVKETRVALSKSMANRVIV